MPSYIYGVHPVSELFKRRSHQVKELIIAREEKGLNHLIEYAEKLKIRVKKISRQELTRLVGTDGHQGIAVEAPLPETLSIKELLNEVKAKESSIVLVLDQIEDPQNLGAIIRVAECAGVDGVIYPRHRSASLSPAVAKASSGAIEWVTLVEVTNLVQALRELKEQGFWVYAGDVNAKENLWEIDFAKKSALVIGSEGAGLRRLTREESDFKVRIPLFGRIESLNASVSSAIFLYEMIRRLKK